MTLTSLLDEKTTLTGLEVSSKTNLLNRMVDMLESKVSAEQLESIRSAVLQREEIMSTGVGKGLAIPHGKAPGLEESYASFALLKEPIDFDSIDEEPVRIVFLLVGPESKNSMHIKLLSRISRLMNNDSFRKQLLECSSPSEVLAHFDASEQLHL
ncbi:MAG: PTS sugar transporter subunit IIA [Bacteroidota bacterium]